MVVCITNTEDIGRKVPDQPEVKVKHTAADESGTVKTTIVHM